MKEIGITFVLLIAIAVVIVMTRLKIVNDRN